MSSKSNWPEIKFHPPMNSAALRALVGLVDCYNACKNPNISFR